MPGLSSSATVGKGLLMQTIVEVKLASDINRSVGKAPSRHKRSIYHINQCPLYEVIALNTIKNHVG